MTNNTIPNVPRELKPCPFCGGEPNLTTADYVHDDLTPMPVVECKSCSAWVQADDWNTRAPSPAGGGGLEVVAWRIGFPNNAGYKVYEQRQPWAYEQYGVPSVIVYEVQELCRLSAAHAIIDGLRGEVEVMTQHANNYAKMFEECAEERDQQARRIGDLEGLLRACHSALYPFDNKMLEAKIDAALSAGKDSAS